MIGMGKCVIVIVPIALVIIVVFDYYKLTKKEKKQLDETIADLTQQCQKTTTALDKLEHAIKKNKKDTDDNHTETQTDNQKEKKQPAKPTHMTTDDLIHFNTCDTIINNLTTFEIVDIKGDHNAEIVHSYQTSISQLVKRNHANQRNKTQVGLLMLSHRNKLSNLVIRHDLQEMRRIYTNKADADAEAKETPPVIVVSRNIVQILDHTLELWISELRA
jgi:hypothetical protein